MLSLTSSESDILSFSQESIKERPRTFRVGSDGSAASGRESDLSEWQRSAKREFALSNDAFAGNRNRGTLQTTKGTAVPLESPEVHRKIRDLLQMLT